jgi:hypothetical protein
LPSTYEVTRARHSKIDRLWIQRDKKAYKKIMQKPGLDLNQDPDSQKKESGPEQRNHRAMMKNGGFVF